MPEKPSETDKRARDAWLRALQSTASIGRLPNRTLPLVIDEVAQRYSDLPALIGERNSFTYRELADCVRRYAGWAVRHGVTGGTTVCLIMRNCPEFLAIWLGIARMGGVVALINHHLGGTALAHAVAVAAPAHIIVDPAFVEALDAVLPEIGLAPKVWVCGADSPVHRRIDRDTDSGKGIVLEELPQPLLSDRALYIYTSGTTGMPKAAVVSHSRILQWSQWFAGMMDARPSDRMYNCLPMYHSVGGVVATCAMLVSGGSVVIRERFSASRFWDDVASSGATIFQYIGELCRYLVNNPPHPKETAHRLRLSCGNGLRADVWPEFRRRFGIPENLEFYAATEANFSLFNCEDEPGAIGRIPPFLTHRFPVALVKFDVASGEPVRDPNGFCIRCETDEVGEAISRMPDASRAGAPFEGYTDRDASAKKVLRDVFAAGDAWFRSGDLMRKDARGFFYFVDRIGDTFRWKGENVSTTEAAAAIGSCPGVVEAVVYGVPVPGAEGRAGMTALVVRGGFNLAALYRHLAAALPDYARPLFLRVCNAIEATETFKQKKQDLLADGYDPSRVADPLYFADREAGAYVPLDAELYDRLARREIRL